MNLPCSVSELCLRARHVAAGVVVRPAVQLLELAQDRLLGGIPLLLGLLRHVAVVAGLNLCPAYLMTVVHVVHREGPGVPQRDVACCDALLAGYGRPGKMRSARA